MTILPKKLQNRWPINNKPKKQDKWLNLQDDDFDEAPILPMEGEPEEEYDLQKELEAKFDELFGPIDEDN